METFTLVIIPGALGHPRIGVQERQRSPVNTASLLEGSVVTMLDFLQPIFPFAFAILWFGGTIALLFLMKYKHRAYLRQFPPGTFDTTLPEYNPWFGEYSIGYARRHGAAERTASPDPERERRRVAAIRTFVFLLLWMFGFPLVTWGMVGILIVAGLVHPH